jgi:hypothetical protein
MIRPFPKVEQRTTGKTEGRKLFHSGGNGYG